MHPFRHHHHHHHQYAVTPAHSSSSNNNVVAHHHHHQHHNMHGVNRGNNHYNYNNNGNNVVSLHHQQQEQSLLPLPPEYAALQSSYYQQPQQSLFPAPPAQQNAAQQSHQQQEPLLSLPQSGSSSSSSHIHQYSSSKNNHPSVVAVQQRKQQEQNNVKQGNYGNGGDNNNNNKNNDQLHQQLADLAMKLIREIETSKMTTSGNKNEVAQKEMEDTIRKNLLEYALPFLEMFLDCFNQYIVANSSLNNNFFDTFSSIIDNRLAANLDSKEISQYQTVLTNYYNENKIKLRNAQDQCSGLLVALGRSCFTLEQALRWNSTQLYVLPANVLENFLDSATSFIEQEFSSTRGQNVAYEEKYCSFTTEHRRHIENVILQKQKRGEDSNFDVIKEMFTLVCTNKTIVFFWTEQLKLPIHFAGYFIRIVNNVFHFIDPMPLRMYYIETTCITFDEQYHRVQMDPHKSIPQFSFHVHLQSTFNLVDGLFLLIESATSLLTRNTTYPFILLGSCFRSLEAFAKFCTPPLVSKNILQVTDDARNYHDPFSSSSSNNNNSRDISAVNKHQEVPTKNRLLQLPHYLRYFLSRSGDRSCSNAAKQVLEVLSKLVWKITLCVFRRSADVERFFSVGFISSEIASGSSSSIQKFDHSFGEIIHKVRTQYARNREVAPSFAKLKDYIKRGRRAMTIKKALSSANDKDQEANGEIDAVEEAFFQDLRDNFDADFARASSSQNSNNATSHNNNNDHPAPPAPLPPSDDGPQINRITPASPSSQQPQRNLPVVHLPAPVTLPAITVAPPPRPRISGLEMLTQLYLEHIAKCGSIEFATSNHHMVVFETLINNNPNITIIPRYEDLSKNETISNETKAEHLLRDGAVATILRRYPLMSFNEQNFFKEILRDCDRTHTAHRNEIDPDFDKKCYRVYLKHNPECSSRANYNYFETTPPSILKKVSNYNIIQDPKEVLLDDGSFRLRQVFDLFEKIPKKVSHNNKRCRWNDDSVDDFPPDATKIAIPFVETDIAFGRWISQRCTAPRLDDKYSASNPGAVFYHHLTVSGFAHKKTKNKDGRANNNNHKNNNNAASAHQQYYGSSRLGGHQVKNNTNKNNIQTNEMMSGQRRARDNNSNQTNKNNNMMMMSGKRRGRNE